MCLDVEPQMQPGHHPVLEGRVADCTVLVWVCTPGQSVRVMLVHARMEGGRVSQLLLLFEVGVCVMRRSHTHIYAERTAYVQIARTLHAVRRRLTSSHLAPHAMAALQALCFTARLLA